MRQRFFMKSETQFQLDPTKDIQFPHKPHSKNRPRWQRHVFRHDVAKVDDFFNGGLWGKLFDFCRIKLKFLFWVHTNGDTYHLSFTLK